eukprot:comp21596_c0_seq1/m.47541 comp21596_c0_seq1/g.47541  ORF comp21596_c0_seq1/g.47541 comp21596_c0_seq1/m.47541 type:complete len:691 (+) comp21596_c0_seq1:130-2202(+)
MSSSCSGGGRSDVGNNQLEIELEQGRRDGNVKVLEHGRVDEAKEANIAAVDKDAGNAALEEALAIVLAVRIRNVARRKLLDLIGEDALGKLVRRARDRAAGGGGNARKRRVLDHDSAHLHHAIENAVNDLESTGLVHIAHTQPALVLEPNIGLVLHLLGGMHHIGLACRRIVRALVELVVHIVFPDNNIGNLKEPDRQRRCLLVRHGHQHARSKTVARDLKLIGRRVQHRDRIDRVVGRRAVGCRSRAVQRLDLRAPHVCEDIVAPSEHKRKQLIVAAHRELEPQELRQLVDWLLLADSDALGHRDWDVVVPIRNRHILDNIAVVEHIRAERRNRHLDRALVAASGLCLDLGRELHARKQRADVIDRDLAAHTAVDVLDGDRDLAQRKIREDLGLAVAVDHLDRLHLERCRAVLRKVGHKGVEHLDRLVHVRARALNEHILCVERDLAVLAVDHGRHRQNDAIRIAHNREHGRARNNVHVVRESRVLLVQRNQLVSRVLLGLEQRHELDILLGHAVVLERALDAVEVMCANRNQSAASAQRKVQLLLELKERVVAVRVKRDAAQHRSNNERTDLLGPRANRDLLRSGNRRKSLGRVLGQEHTQRTRETLEAQQIIAVCRDLDLVQHLVGKCLCVQNTRLSPVDFLLRRDIVELNAELEAQLIEALVRVVLGKRKIPKKMLLGHKHNWHLM